MKKARPILKKIGLALCFAIWTCAVIFIVQFLFAKLLSLLLNILPFTISSAVAQTIFSLLSYTVSIIIIFSVPKKLNVTRTTLGLDELPTWTDIGLAPVGLIVYALLASLLTSIFTIFPWFVAEETQDVGFNSLVLTSDRIFAFITLVLIAPIAEELIFRGFLYQKIKTIFYKKTSSKNPTNSKKLPKPEIIAIATATIITSLAFGVMHGQWNVGVNVFAMSIVLCIMREITGSIYSGILLHMLKNAIAFYLLYIATLGF